MLKLIKAAKCYVPEPVNDVEILIAGGKIIGVGKKIEDKLKLEDVEVLECGPNSIVAPGLIDQHVHLLGGGGEGGYHTRVPEVTISDITKYGVTTVVGMLGTDDMTRHLDSLLAKARGLENEGISTYILTGSYSLPTPTMTGSVKRDLVLIDKVLGAGEIAISDHRSSKAGYQALKDVAVGCRLGGLVSGKIGLLHLHVGNDPAGLAPVRQLLKDRVIPARQISATHVNRSEELLKEGLELLNKGVNIDLTTFGRGGRAVSATDAISFLIKEEVNLDKVTLSSDSNGSMPQVDDEGRIIGLKAASMKSLLNEVQTLYKEQVLSLEDIIALVTKNPANVLGLNHKGTIEVGADADITIFDKSLNVKTVIARGQTMLENGNVLVKGTFE
ncbi:beta-aspartyl-peptidase [Proteinivorax tanatarense]|uniref:Isoaspartyl dipeptidase n=1 Tax=Proteinivorax tanatarense TaxID=1260629 RepID=A0AAU7VNB0_9FIRM